MLKILVTTRFTRPRVHKNDKDEPGEYSQWADVVKLNKRTAIVRLADGSIIKRHLSKHTPNGVVVTS